MIKEILVYLDEDDVQIWQDFENIILMHKNKEKTDAEYTNARIATYSYLIDKYGVLKSKKFYVDPKQKCIFLL